MDNRTSRNTRVLALGATSVLLIVSAFSAAAVAAPVPPGYSAVDQYTEAYPGVGGDNKPPAGNGTETSGSIPAKTVDRFEQAGPSGAAAVALALATAPQAGAGSKENLRSGPPGKATDADSTQDASSPANGNLEIGKQVFGVAGSDGMGLFLPLIIVVASIMAIVYGVRQRRMPA